uniref:COesterase domain-containing protein n=1 Tax=Rhabditophanes sp. KR3021 TaxID=114890 RepID=A0AC35UI29_9BILA
MHILCLSTNPKKRIQTTFGVLKGETISPDAEDLPAVTQYLGVPFGVSPTGQNRFNLAISAAKWTHMPKDAFKISSVCMQTRLPATSETKAFKSMSSQRFDHVHRLLLHLKPESEDCLYMNIYIPEKIERNDENKIPSLLIIHGDSYNWNSGNSYNGSLLAAYGQVAVITMNYRLGAFGFLGRCESNSCTGNAGLSDLVAALKMLSNILPSFGASPDSLTLLGWGTGANLISLLMASPITLPKSRLFHRAILLDGTALSPSAIQENPQEFYLKLAEELNCVDNSANLKKVKDSRKDIKGILRCLQEHSAENITQASSRLEIPTFLNAFAPIIDGQIVPNHPKISFSPQFGSLFRDVDLMIGTVSYPAHSLLPNEDLIHGFDNSKRDKILRTIVRNFYSNHRSEIFESIIHEYTDWENGKNKHPKQIRNEMLQALGDVLFTTPLIETLRMHSTDEQPKSGNTFFFVFGHETKGWSKEHPTNGIRGSLTGDHVPYILGYPLSNHHIDNLYTSFSNEDKEMSKCMMTYVTNFIKTGDPTKPRILSKDSNIESKFQNIIWPQFNQGTREAYLDIVSDQPRIRNYYRNSYVGFWSEFVPQLIESGKDKNLPEEHSFLKDHFNRNSFFGNVRHYGNYKNEGFPPPPQPPPPSPNDLLIKMGTTPPTPNAIASENSTPTTVAVNEKCNEYSTLGITVAIGSGLLVLNVCIFIGMYHQCNKTSKPEKNNFASYQGYNSAHLQNNPDLYIPNSPVRHITLLPPPTYKTHLTNVTKEVSSTSNKPRHSLPATFNKINRRKSNMKSTPLTSITSDQFQANRNDILTQLNEISPNFDYTPATRNTSLTYSLFDKVLV